MPSKRQDRFEQCGASAYVEYSKEEKRYRVRAFYCGDRFCVPCARSRAARVRPVLLRLCGERRVRVITFTRRSTPTESLEAGLDHLLESFAKVRRSKCWKDAVEGGVGAVETKVNAAGNWHTHLHVITVGKWIDAPALREAWHKATGDSWIVDIMGLQVADRGVGYVLKYVGKGFDQSVFADPEKLRECIRAFKGRRLLIPFGSWFGKCSEDVEPGADDWKSVGSIDAVTLAAEAGEEWAVGVMMDLRSQAESKRGRDDGPMPEEESIEPESS